MNYHPLESLIELFLAEKDITKGTYELYNTVLKQYVDYLKDHNILYAKKSDVISYIKWKRSQGYSTNWLYNIISPLKGLYRYLSVNQKRLNLEEEYAFDILESFKNVKKVNVSKSKSILTAKQAKHLILSTKENRKYIWQYRDHAMIYLMITTGLRTVEIQRARIKDLRVINNQLILDVQGKGRDSADEYVKIVGGVEEAIKDYLKKRKDKNPYLFVSHSRHSNKPHLTRTFFPKMLKRVLRECGMKENLIKPHSLRHTAATLNLQRGGTLKATAKLLRHSDIQNTLIYAHHLENLKDDTSSEIEDYILKEKEK